MPRKKNSRKLITYYIPVGSKEKIDTVVDTSLFYKNKSLWKQKLYHLIEYISFQNLNNELDFETDYVNVHQETMASILGTTNQQIATMLKDTVIGELLIKDGIWKAAVLSKQGEYIEEGKSFGYQLKNWSQLNEVVITDNRHISEKIQNNTWEVTCKYFPDINLYHGILKEIKIDVEYFGCKVFEIISNKQKKKSQKENYMKFMESIETTLNQKRNKIRSIIPFDGKFVPVANSKAVSPYLHPLEGGKSVPCQECSFELLRFHKRKRKTKEINEEKAETTIARCKRAISKINDSTMLPNRPDGDSRVYCEITNLNRELRSSLKINGRKIVGVDIGNSQPLIASILLRQYWLNKIGDLPEDVKQYQRDCEAGEFYQNFMVAINLPEDFKPQFKEDFFRKVFFSKVIEKNNILKEMFIAKYPSCWEAICDEKGGLYSKEYNEFAKKLQRVEAAIIFDFVNIGLIKKGIKAFNIFDSIYVNNRTDFDTAIQLIEQGFNAVGVNPKINIEYKEHLEENERMAALEHQHQSETTGEYDTQVINEMVQNEEYLEQPAIPKINQSKLMKKKYTVDDLLSSKKKTIVYANSKSTKLQHLKLQTEERATMKNTEESNKDAGVKMSDKQIYDFVVEHLKSEGFAINKSNVESLTKVVKEELSGRVKLEEVKQPYKFVNPYV